MQYRQQQAQIMRRRMAQMQCGVMSTATPSPATIPSSTQSSTIHSSASKPTLAPQAIQPSQTAPPGALVAVKQVQQAAQMQV